MTIITDNGILDDAFIHLVYDAVAQISMGKVATYGQIAEMAGDPKAGRDVGLILSRVTDGHGLPCHRVVNRTGALAPEYVFGGQERQRAMLEAEEVTFLADGRIDMERHEWVEKEQLSLFW